MNQNTHNEDIMKKRDSSPSAKRFFEQRESLNDTVMKYADIGIKRFFNLDTSAYTEGALSVKVKEMLGLTASLVLRCDDCITYHLHNCFSSGITSDELAETADIALIVGGSIIIPHLRRMFKEWDMLKAGSDEGSLSALI